MTGKKPEVPSMKDKIMFWKTYQHYIKQEIQRMRTSSTNSFKTLFIKGKHTTMKIRTKSSTLTHLVVITFFQIEYQNNYGKLNDNGHENGFTKMINYCKRKGPQFGDDLINYEAVDDDILFCFFNLAMTTTATVKFKEIMTYEKFSDTVTIFEEEFAILVLENYFDRWVYLAERKIRKNPTGTSNHEDNDMASDSSRSSTDNSNSDEGEEVPDVLYQVKVKQRSDKINTAGKWIKMGMDRLNKLISIVEEDRNSSKREQFEIGLQEKYITYADNNVEMQNKKKRKRELEEMASMSNKTVVVKNVLNLVAL